MLAGVLQVLQGSSVGGHINACTSVGGTCRRPILLACPHCIALTESYAILSITTMRCLCLCLIGPLCNLFCSPSLSEQRYTRYGIESSCHPIMLAPAYRGSVPSAGMWSRRNLTLHTPKSFIPISHALRVPVFYLPLQRKSVAGGRR